MTMMKHIKSWYQSLVFPSRKDYDELDERYSSTCEMLQEKNKIIEKLKAIVASQEKEIDAYKEMGMSTSATMYRLYQDIEKMQHLARQIIHTGENFND